MSGQRYCKRHTAIGTPYPVAACPICNREAGATPRRFPRSTKMLRRALENADTLGYVPTRTAVRVPRRLRAA